MHRRLVAGLFVATALAATVPSARADEAQLALLGWLPGCWNTEQAEPGSGEPWLPLAGGSLLGVSRTVRGGKAIGFEFMRIAQQEERWVFLAQPGGGAVTTFPVEHMARDRVVFTNPAHDFPKRVIYSRPDADTLHARVDDGRDDGKAMEWNWRRDCVAPPRE